MEGRRRSVSTTIVFNPIFANEIAKFIAVVDFPSEGFAEQTLIFRLLSLRLRLLEALILFRVNNTERICLKVSVLRVRLLSKFVINSEILSCLRVGKLASKGYGATWLAFLMRSSRI